ncbi:MAG: 2-oxoglutarate dehydrogenase complex dihydrolipoyllysine-residue succinyltransferase [Paracoccaceae bacterium]
MNNIVVPTLGESVTEATVATWFKKVGDQVSIDEMLCELETDKVAIEVPSAFSGTLVEIIAPEGSIVGLNAVLGKISNQVSESSKNDQISSNQNEVTKYQEKKLDIENAPAAKKIMAEHNINERDVTGSGKEGRILKEDVKAFIKDNKFLKNKEPEKPNTSELKGQEFRDSQGQLEEVKRMSRLRQTIAERLKSAQNTAAILTTYNEIDMTEVMAIRQTFKDEFELKHSVKLGFMSFFIKACCHALKEIPEVNAEIRKTDIVYKNFVNMGVAVGTENGLVVPVIRNADELNFASLEIKLNELGNKARNGELTMSEMAGGTFTISNGGVYGSLMSSPILNPPQSGILGMHKIQERPVALSGEIVIRPMMYLALSYDHRIVDGKGAVTFLVRVKEALEDPRRLLMDL